MWSSMENNRNETAGTVSAVFHCPETAGLPLEALLAREPFAVTDGALATELERAGFSIDDPLWSALALMEAPERIYRVHRSYLEAGADIITTASYQGTIPGFMKKGCTRTEAVHLLRLSVAIARKARDDYEAETGRHAFVAASVGPYGAYLADGSEYRGQYGLTGAELAAFHRERLDILMEAGPDLLACETLPCLEEAEALADCLAPYPPGCAWLSFSCADGCHTCGGDDAGDCAAFLDGVPQIAAVGVNCTAPTHVVPLLARMHRRTEKPLIAYPNSGEVYDTARRCWTGTPVDFTALLPQWLAAGARLVGGCCRTTPETIRRLAAARDAWKKRYTEK